MCVRYVLKLTPTRLEVEDNQMRRSWHPLHACSKLKRDAVPMKFFSSIPTKSRKAPNLMYHKFHQLLIWLSWRKITKLMPPCFKVWYQSTKIIIDCTEFFISTPPLLARQSSTWSSYKNHSTVKVLIGITPHGHITFVSSVFEGSISDKAEEVFCEVLPKYLQRRSWS